MRISLIIPVYNRPAEVEELLQTLAEQTRGDFEVVVVEDGSSVTSADVVARFAPSLDIVYIAQDNTGPAGARNTGAAAAHGDFFIFMDSDCLVPSRYFETVYGALEAADIEFFGGPDSAAPDFSPMQKAVSYSMTSLFTTGGIRGRARSIGKFSPRSFNLGIARSLFERVGGFSDMRIGEDIDFSLKVVDTGAKAWLLPEAVVCHKRRTSFRLFFKQVFIFGVARVNLNIRHPHSRRAVFLLPALFTVGSVALLVAAAIWSPWLLAAFAVPMLVWFIDSATKNRNIRIGWLSIWTSFIQLYGYGTGFLYGLWMRRLRGRDERHTYKVTKFFSRKTR